MNGCGFVDQPKHQTTTTNKKIEIYYQNVRGLRTKLQKFYASIASSGEDLFAVTETGCNESIQDAEMIPPGYTIIRCDRTDGRKQGGACLVATPRIQMRRVAVPCDVNIEEHAFELVCATICLHNRLMFVLCVVYIAPKSKERDYMVLFKIIEQYCSMYRKVIVIGDFNLFSCPLSVNNYFEYFSAYCGFTQSNKIGNCNDRQLDLVLSTYGGSAGVGVRAADEPLVPVDAYHPPLVVTAALPPAAAAAAAGSCRAPILIDGTSCRTNAQFGLGWNFSKANFPLLYSLMANVDWSPMYALGWEGSLSFFYDTMNSIVDRCAPKKTRSKANLRYVYPEWYTGGIIRDLKLKSILHKRYKKSGSRSDYEEFARCRARVKSSIQIAEEQYCHRVQSNLLENPKSFWNYAKSKRGSRTTTKILKNGEALTGEECAEEFADYFHSVYNSERPELNVAAAIAAAGGQNGAARVHVDQLKLDDVCTALQRLKPKKSAGPDGFPPYFFRDCRAVLAAPLLHMYNQCLKASVFPEEWKITRVVPVPKGALETRVEGYRPVAVLSTPAKILESAIHKNIFGQVSMYLSDEQHGFRPARSTTSNLLNYMSGILPSVDSGVQVDAAYFDFKKAFDLVDTDILLMKLAGIGFTPHLLQFFASYMRDRQQYVEYGGHTSEPYFTRTGVSQGSNLGPLEFILMVNDLPRVVREAKCLLFADDLKLYLPIRSSEDCARLQEDIDRVVNWSKENRLQFNTSKCAIITFSRAHSPIQNDYKIDRIPMARLTEVKDLGVILKTNLCFRDYIVTVCKKAYRNLGFVLRRVNGFTNMKAIIALYNALVRSRLECNALIWGPHEAKYAVMMERVQNKFTRYLYMKQYGVYPYYPLMYPTLFVLGMIGYNTLTARRDLALVLYIFKIFRGKIHNAELLEQIGIYVPDGYVGRRRRPQLLVVPRGRTNLVDEAPWTRALRALNLVAGQIDLFTCTLSEFTRAALFVICYVN